MYVIFIGTARYINKYETNSDYQGAITDNEYSGTTYDVANTSLIDDTRRKKYDHKITLGTGSVLQSLDITGNSGFDKSTWLVGTNIASSNKLKGHKGFGTHLLKNTITNVDNTLTEMSPSEIMHFEYSESTLTSITIPEGVTHIYTGAFQKCTNLREVKLPSTLQYIGKRAFRGCTSLASIVIPASVTKIDVSAFSYCTSLREVIFAEGINLKCINPTVFKGCKSLVSLSLPDSVLVIKKNAFRECVSLRYLKIGSGLRFVNPNCFRNCFSLERIDCSHNEHFREENGVTIMETTHHDNIRRRVIHVNTSLTEVTIPVVVSIHYGVLRNCRNLRRITCLGINAPYRATFAGCQSLESLTLYVKSHSNMPCAFINCPRLSNLTIIPTHYAYYDFGGDYATAFSDRTDPPFGTFTDRGYQSDCDGLMSRINLRVPVQYVPSFINSGFNSVIGV